jgi:quercetin dioxygenase-like cupin family protein
MSITKVVLMLVCLVSLTAMLTLQPPAASQPGATAQPAATPQPSEAPQPKDAEVKELFTKDLPDLPGKEGLMLSVVYLPGASDPIHRHNADAFIYVLEGSIIMQVRGGKEVTLAPGQTYYEGPNDIHTVGRNASQTKPAKFVVFMVKEKGAPVLTPTN